MEKNLLKQLNKAYKARLKILNDKAFLEDIEIGLLIFVERLRYIRDLLIISSSTDEAGPPMPEDPFSEFSEQVDLEKQIDPVEEVLASLIVTIAEFDAYQASEDDTQKTFHLNNFWELIKVNMEEWLALNDTI